MKMLKQQKTLPYSFIKHCFLAAVGLIMTTASIAETAPPKPKINIYLREMVGSPDLKDTAWQCDKPNEGNPSWDLKNCAPYPMGNDPSLFLTGNKLEERPAQSFTLGTDKLYCTIESEFNDGANKNIELKSCDTDNASCAGAKDDEKQNPFKPCSDLTIADPSKFPQSDYPGCIGKTDQLPSQCRGLTSIVGQHTYAQRFNFKGWGIEQGYCAGTEKTRVLIYATTNDAMKAASADYADFGTLDMAISDKAGDLNPTNSACKWTGAPNITVSVPIAQDGVTVRGSACKLIPDTMYYINVKPTRNRTAECGLGSPLNCQFSIYTKAVPIRTSSCR